MSFARDLTFFNTFLDTHAAKLPEENLPEILHLLLNINSELAHPLIKTIYEKNPTDTYILYLLLLSAPNNTLLEEKILLNEITAEHVEKIFLFMHEEDWEIIKAKNIFAPQILELLLQEEDKKILEIQNTVNSFLNDTENPYFQAFSHRGLWKQKINFEEDSF